MRKECGHFLVSAFLALCAITGTGQAQSPEVSPSIELVSVEPTKVLYDVGEPVIGQVTVSNPSQSPQTVIVRAWLEWQIDERTEPQRAPLVIEPGSTGSVNFRWEKVVEQFGHALRAEVLVGDQVVAGGEEYFQVSDNYWKVSLIAAFAGVHHWGGYEENWIIQKPNEWRKDYYNGFEKFFWAPDDVLELTPENEQWYSSLGHYPENKSGLKRFIDEAHRLGMKAITYARYSGGGSHGLEIARRHPEWVEQSNGTLALGRQVRQLEEWDTPMPTGMRGWVEIRWNLSLPSVLEAAIRELAESAAMFGWDGARWDGTYYQPTEWHDLEGRPSDKLTPDQAEAKNAENFRRHKEFISARYPGFVFGNNWTENFASSIRHRPRESIELCRGGGLVMNEGIRNAGQPQYPLHRWKDYALRLANDVELVKRLGGYYGPILDLQGSGADSQYKCVFAYAAGAHPYYDHLWGAFVTRYSALLWDPALTRIVNPEFMVMVPDTVWWKQWVFARTLDASHQQLIIHLINPPAAPTVGASPNPEDVPPPVENVELKILPTLPDGWKPMRATRLSPAPQVVESLPIQNVEGINMVTVPEVALWNILVIDLNKQEGGP